LAHPEIFITKIYLLFSTDIEFVAQLWFIYFQRKRGRSAGSKYAKRNLKEKSALFDSNDSDSSNSKSDKDGNFEPSDKDSDFEPSDKAVRFCTK
jgi:hypothetical protein